MREKADSDLVRRQNRRLVLEALRLQGPLARVELGRLTGLSPASITSISAQLIADGILEEVGDAQAPVVPLRRGRPLIQIDVNTGSAFVVAVKISIDGLDLALADGRGTILERHGTKLATYDAAPDTFGDLVAAGIAAFLGRAKLPPAKVARIGIAVQGVADSLAGSIVWSPAFRARNIPLMEPVQRRLGIPCSVANDANMIAEGLTGLDRARYGGTAAVAFIGYGVGMGLVIDGQVYHGATGAAAEFGHMNHQPGGALCRCGRRGCIEAYAADYGILRRARQNPDGMLLSHSAVPQEDLLDLEHAARRGDSRALEAYAKAGEALGYGFARLIALLSPSHIVLTGPGTRAMAFIEPHMRAAIEAGVVDELRRNVEIDVVPIDTDMIVKGTIGGALRHLDGHVFANGPAISRETALEVSA